MCNTLKILILDAYCNSHVGNDVLLESSLKVLTEMFPNAQIRVHAKSRDAFEDSQHISCGQRLFTDAPRSKIRKVGWLLSELCFMLVQTLNALTIRVTPHKLVLGERRQSLIDYEEADIAVSIGGEMINDAFRKTLLNYLFMFWFAKRCGLKVILFPQSIGPLNRIWTRTAASYVFNRCDIVSPRDAPSNAELISLGVDPTKIYPCPDVGVLQPLSADEDADNFLMNEGIQTDSEKLWIGLTLSYWTEESGARNEHLETIINCIKNFVRKREVGVVIMPANMPIKGNVSDDYEASDAAFRELEHSCKAYLLSSKLLPARMFKSIAARMDIFISTRMHAAILASMAGTPTITINTQRKLRGFMELIDQSEYSLDVVNLDEGVLMSAITEAVAARDQIKLSLMHKKEDLSKEVREFVVNVNCVLAMT